MEEVPLSVVRFCFSKPLDSPQNSEVPTKVPVSHKSPVRLWKPVEGEGVNLDNMNSLASGCVRFVRRGIRRPEEEGVIRITMKGGQVQQCETIVLLRVKFYVAKFCTTTVLSGLLRSRFVLPCYLVFELFKTFYFISLYILFIGNGRKSIRAVTLFYGVYHKMVQFSGTWKKLGSKSELFLLNCQGAGGALNQRLRPTLRHYCQ